MRLPSPHPLILAFVAVAWLLSIVATPRSQTTQSQTPPPSQSRSTPTNVTQQITVTATRSSIDLPATANTIYTLSAHDLSNYPATELDDKLRQQAGFELLPPLQLPRAEPHQPGHLVARPRLHRRQPHPRAPRQRPHERSLRRLDPLGRDPRRGRRRRHHRHRRRLRPLRLQRARRRHRRRPRPTHHRPLRPQRPRRRSVHLLHRPARRPRQHAPGVNSSPPIPSAPPATSPPHPPSPVLSTSPPTSTTSLPAAKLTASSQTTNRAFLIGNMLNEARGNGTTHANNATRLWRYIAGDDWSANP